MTQFFRQGGSINGADLRQPVLFGIAQGPSTPASTYLISRSAPPDKLSLATSLQQCGPPMAWALGGVLVPALIGLMGWRWASAVMAECSALARNNFKAAAE